MATRRVSITISGRVHNVGFRFFSREAAENIGLTGWVRNSPMRTVEIEVQGEDTLLNLFFKKVGHGPRLAHVEDVVISDIPIQKNETSFDIFH